MKNRMNRAKKNSILSLLVFTAFIAFLFYAIGERFDKETEKMTPAMSGKIADGIRIIRNGYVNFFLIEKDGNIIAIDSGIDNKSRSDMHALGVDSDKVAAVFLTHSDKDHIGGIDLFPGASVYLSKEEEQMINGKTKRMLVFKNKLNRKYSTMIDGQTVTIGNFSVNIMYLPGHTPGSAGYIVDGKYLFTGDTLSLKNGKADIFNEFFNMDTPKQKESIERLKKIQGVQYLFTSHYGYSDNVSDLFK